MPKKGGNNIYTAVVWGRLLPQAKNFRRELATTVEQGDYALYLQHLIHF